LIRLNSDLFSVQVRAFSNLPTACIVSAITNFEEKKFNSNKKREKITSAILNRSFNAALLLRVRHIDLKSPRVIMTQIFIYYVDLADSCMMNLFYWPGVKIQDSR
jgi:hypothetical protein